MAKQEKRIEPQQKKPAEAAPEQAKKELVILERDKTLNVFQRLSLAMGLIGGLKQTGTNTHFDYKFYQEKEVSSRVQAALVQAGIFAIPDIVKIDYYDPLSRERTTWNKPPGIITRVHIEYTFYNIDDPKDLVKFNFHGEGQDPADKGLYKALTGLHKYMQLRLFNVGTGHDPEADSRTDESAQEATMRKPAQSQQKPQPQRAPAQQPPKLASPPVEFVEVLDPNSGLVFKAPKFVDPKNYRYRYEIKQLMPKTLEWLQNKNFVFRARETSAGDSMPDAGADNCWYGNIESSGLKALELVEQPKPLTLEDDQLPDFGKGKKAERAEEPPPVDREGY